MCTIMRLVCSKLSPPKPQGGPCDSDWTTATGHCVSFHLNWSSWPGGIFPRLSLSCRHLDCSNLSGENWLWFSVYRWTWPGEWLLFASLPLESHLKAAWYFVGLFWLPWSIGSSEWWQLSSSFLIVPLTLISSESIIWLVECGVF